MNPATSTAAEQLSEAFAEFEGVSRELSGSYRQLERRVAGLAHELTRSRLELARELEEKQRLAARLENLLDALPAGIVVLDHRGAVQSFNPVARELLGPLESGEAWATVVTRAFAPREGDGHDVSLANGRLVNLATQALSGEPGQILLLTDVTETRRLQDQLAHHKRISAKTEMAAAMAHQIRTPLATALLHTGNLARATSAALRERAGERALGALRKLERLVDELLLFARGGRLEVETVAVDDLFRHLEAAALDAFQLEDFALRFVHDACPGEVRVNLAAVTSVVLNFIDNACQATNGRGSIEVSQAIVDGALELSFRDDGPGVDAAMADALFEPFVTSRSNGTGLGLPVARAVARAHGGEVRLAPSTVGACFLMQLPLAADGAGRRVTRATTSLNNPE
ncbi:MAG: sensor histidine kinase [Gammaproteobacteria bacterium]